MLQKKCLKVSLLGNPNVGKTTLFNRLTGNAQYVGNWPGVTVEKKEGYIRNVERSVKITDLPGVYSLSPFSPEEIVTRNYILENNVDLLINIVDATNLERNLYLTTQALELGIPTVIALNMCDILKRKGKVIDFCSLEKSLGVRVVPISASKNVGIKELVDSIVNFKPPKNKIVFKYTNDVEKKLSDISEILKLKNIKFYDNRFILIKLLEYDSLIISNLGLDLQTIKDINKIRENQKEFRYEEFIASQRYEKSSIICKNSVSEVSNIKKTKFSREIDKIVTNKFLSFPIFALVIFIIFYISFGSVGTSLQDFSRLIIFKGISHPLDILLEQFNANEIIKGFFCFFVGGIGEVLSFMPQILLLLGLLSILEDSGYMARAAFIVDKLMHKIGLHGKSFIPMVMGFGCNVPAIMATRSIESRKSRLVTIAIIPFMSCAGRLPIFVLFAGAFFPSSPATALLLIYLLGVVLAILSAKVLSRFVKDDDLPFVMELPPYRMPTGKATWRHTWEKGRQYLEKMATTILIFSIVLWFMGYFPRHEGMGAAYQQEHSCIGVVGKAVEPAMAPLGFNWKMDVGLLAGVGAKELVISSLGVMYAQDGEDYEADENDTQLQSALKATVPTAAALAYMVFVLLYFPCIATFMAIKNETGKWRWAFLCALYTLVVAWLFAFAAFRLGLLIWP